MLWPEAHLRELTRKQAWNRKAPGKEGKAKSDWMKPWIVTCVKRDEARSSTRVVGRRAVVSPEIARGVCYVFALLLGSESIRILLKRGIVGL